MNKASILAEREILLPVNGAKLIVTSPDFSDGGMLPKQYTCDGANISPALDISNIPFAARCLAIIMDDPYHPDQWLTHWIAWNIPPFKHIPEARKMEAEGVNDFQLKGYYGPCPSQWMHRYQFKVFALDTLLRISSEAHATDLQEAMNGHILGFGQIAACYLRK